MPGTSSSNPLQGRQSRSSSPSFSALASTAVPPPPIPLMAYVDKRALSSRHGRRKSLNLGFGLGAMSGAGSVRDQGTEVPTTMATGEASSRTPSSMSFNLSRTSIDESMKGPRRDAGLVPTSRVNPTTTLTTVASKRIDSHVIGSLLRSEREIEEVTPWALSSMSPPLDPPTANLNSSTTSSSSSAPLKSISSSQTGRSSFSQPRLTQSNMPDKSSSIQSAKRNLAGFLLGRRGAQQQQQEPISKEPQREEHRGLSSSLTSAQASREERPGAVKGESMDVVLEEAGQTPYVLKR